MFLLREVSPLRFAEAQFTTVRFVLLILVKQLPEQSVLYLKGGLSVGV
jgi:hypothetical protein